MRSCFAQDSYVKNDDVYPATFDDTPKNLRTVNFSQNKNSAIVWAAVSMKKLHLKFFDKGLKISTEYYKQETLTIHLLSHPDRLYSKKNWIF